ncbi:MAG: DUF169 domain-containing protein [Gammaproteobacteria bacterium]|nr:DUF169 domain-containing protein [Gammaproteobacteria bacterium]NIR81731.1 DUF169 domain-containing protein [Gammaproteobacteria bacterium]NIR88534.1 DUF169 domain-containing protein [Gammaproteobacteria bacterium]NIU02838.1 DUF169 domain-containing protein [Gammaproteobacteria bacterium]NIV50360.1 hypothetical protein [Gammaproteobacteria bacterium]
MALAHDYAQFAARLTELLGLSVPPMAITFWRDDDCPVERYAASMPEPTEDGRTGAVAAGCVFWMKGPETTFSTVEADHGNCSVGSATHGFKQLNEVAGNADVQALVESEWVTFEAMAGVATVKDKPKHIIYGPLSETPVDPDVVFLRINAKQAMILNDSLPDLRFEGKPQCHIVAIAKQAKQPAVSTGCMLSRVRTGMSNNEMTCALPVQDLPGLIGRISAGAGADRKVAAYASDDSQRFR